jgi:murein DD-endopeptidase MepM/ murein hydrolase activator NlpD
MFGPTKILLKKIAYILISAIIFPLATLGQEGPIMSENENPETGVYVPDADTSNETELEPQFQSLSFDMIHPAHEIYMVWDTMAINPYHIDMANMCDTVLLDLTNGNPKGFSMPVPGDITSVFGFRKNRYHYGIDLNLRTGDTVVSAFDGTVRLQKKSKSYGNYIIVRHPNGLETLYAHLKAIKVTNNQEVKAGELIGLGGSTGRSTGPHLHFEVRYLGQPFNPSEIINFYGCCLKEDYYLLDKSTFGFIADAKKIRYYKVRSGDTLGKIARRYGVSVSYLCKINHIKSTSLLRVGHYLRYS